MRSKDCTLKQIYEELDAYREALTQCHKSIDSGKYFFRYFSTFPVVAPLSIKSNNSLKVSGVNFNIL